MGPAEFRSFFTFLDIVPANCQNYHMKAKFAIALSIIVLSVAVGVGMDRSSEVLRIKDGKTMSFDRMIQDVKKADIILVGEVHDMPEHHQLELEVIRTFHEADAPLVVGLEMFRADSQQSLDEWVKGVMPVDKFLPVYYDNWREAWPLYKDIFSYAREHTIPLIGLNIPDKIAETVAQRGFTSLTATEKKQLPQEISCDIDPTYMEFIKKAYAGHSQRDEGKFLNFCEAQMVWDKTMAWHLVTYLNNHPGKTVIVLAGVGHAWKRGIPEQIAKLSKFKTAVIVPVIPGQVEPDSVTIHDADYVVLR